MTRRDLALLILAGYLATLVVAGVLVLATQRQIDPAAALATLGTVATLVGVAISRLSAGPTQPTTTET